MKKKASKRAQNIATGTLPKTGAKQVEAVYASLVADGWTPPKASQVAWGVAKRSYKKDPKTGQWKKRAKKLGRSTMPKRGHKGRRGNPLPGTPTRAPIRMSADVEGAGLGDVLEVQLQNGQTIRWDRGLKMVWVPKFRALLWVEGGSRSKASPSTERSSRAAKTFEKWAQRGVSKERTIEAPDEGKWTKVDVATRIDYWSDKWSKKEEYTHELGRGVCLYRFGGAKPPWLWVLKGGDLRITAHGIEG